MVLPAQPGFLTVAHKRELLTPLQAQEVFAEWNRCRDHDLHRNCGEVAVELGYLDDEECATVWNEVVASRQREEAPQDVLRAQVTRRRGPRGRRALLAVVVGLLWLVLAIAMPQRATVLAIAHFVVWTCTEAFFDADEPAMRAGGHRIGWSTVLRYLISGGWLISLGYGAYRCARLLPAVLVESPPVWTDVRPHIGALVGAFGALAAYSTTILLTAWWRRRRLRCAAARKYLMRALIHRCTELRRASRLRLLNEDERAERLDEILRNLAEIVAHNHWLPLVTGGLSALKRSTSWIPLVGRLFRNIPRRRGALDAVSVSLVSPSEASTRMRLNAFVSPGAPDDVQRAMDRVRERHAPAALDEEWFRQNMSACKDVRRFRELEDRRDHVSLAGSAFALRRAFAVSDVQTCPFYDKRFIELLEPKERTRDVVEWLNFSAVIAIPVPPNARDTAEQEGVLMVHRNVPGGILPEDLTDVASAARALGMALQGG